MARKSYISPEGDALDLDEGFFREATRGRPPLPEGARKRRVQLLLDPDIVEKLKDRGNMSGTANDLLRQALGL